MLLPVLVFGPMVGALGCYLIGRKSKRLRDAAVGAVGVLTLLGCLLTWGDELTFSLEGFCGLGLHLRADGFRSLYATVAAFMWALTGLFSPEYFAHYRNRNRYYFFNLMTLGATLGVFLSDDLYTTFIFFEVMSLTSYTWVAHEETDGAMRAAGTYLAVAVIGGLTTLMGLFMLWHRLGTLQFDAMRAILEKPLDWCEANGQDAVSLLREVKVASWLVLFGFAAKGGLFPLHIWLPKAHPVAPAPASALLSGILTKSGVFGVIVICANLRMDSVAFGQALLVLGCVTMFLGAVMALFSIDLKRTLACSSMSQMGFITVGLSAMVLLGEEGGMAASGSLMHMVNHSLIKLCLFMCAGVVYMNLHQLDLNAIRGFGRRKPVLHIAFLLGALSIGCIPPLGSGYISKSLIHEGLLEYIELLRESGACWQPIKAAELLFLVSGGLTVAYMTKLYVCLFWQKNADPEVQKKYDGMKRYIRPFSAGVLLLSSLVLPVLGLLPDLLFTPMAERALSFFRQSFPHHVAYFSGENLLGAAKSIGIGAAVYLLIVRYLLMKKDGSYLNRWPRRLDLEELLYRPLLLRWLPDPLVAVIRVIEGLPEWLVTVCARLAVLLTRLVGEAPEWLVLAARGSVFRKSMPAMPIPAGNRFTNGLGCCCNRVAAGLNATVFRKRPLRTDMELVLGNGWQHMKQRTERVSRSVSWALLLMALGLLAACLYLLLR